MTAAATGCLELEIVLHGFVTIVRCFCNWGQAPQTRSRKDMQHYFRLPRVPWALWVFLWKHRAGWVWNTSTYIPVSQKSGKHEKSVHFWGILCTWATLFQSAAQGPNEHNTGFIQVRSGRISQISCESHRSIPTELQRFCHVCFARLSFQNLEWFVQFV